MKAVLLFVSALAIAATQTVIDPTPARLKLQEVIAEISKSHELCLKGGTKQEECEKQKEDALYANGMPRDWFEKGQKEYQEFWAKREKKK